MKTFANECGQNGSGRGAIGTRRAAPSAPGLAALALALAALGIGAPAQATSVAPVILVDGVGYGGAPLTTGGIYTVQVNLNPIATATFGRSSFVKSHYCGGDLTDTPEYCVTDVYSKLVGVPVISGVTLDGYDLSDEDTISGGTLSFLDGSYIPGTHVINFTETFSESRTASTYFYGNKNPKDDGYSATAGPYDVRIPSNFGGSLLSCGFTGSVDYGVSLAASRFNTVANCSLSLTYEFPVTPPPPPPVAGVPEPSTWAMMVLGFGAIGAALRRKRHSAAIPA